MTTKKRKICSVGTCGNIVDYNVCGISRPSSSLIDKVNFDDGFIALDKRFYVYHLLQQEKIFKSLNLLNFSLYLKLVSYHLFTLESTYRLSNETNLTKLISPFKIDLYLVRVCDLETAKKNDLTIEDILKQPRDIKNHQLKDNYDILLQYSVQINCSTECVFNEHEIVICRKFLKEEQKTCKISNNTDENIVYDTANYRLIILEDTFGEYDSDYPVFILGGSIDIAYHPDLTQVNKESNDINDKNIFNSIKEEITDSIKTNDDIKDLIDNSILKQDDKNKLHNLRKQKLYEKIFNEIEKEEKIFDLIENNKFDKLIQDSDLINQQKKFYRTIEIND
ncbi:148_t:CDS:2 [Racocetra persica]|uniref:148_t:CDS:1 n=1 Tax=Racocetra persica TaxID=160502 RepID=A0ACA9QH64_9GLOM|nr:148_t:CDS:2 [Racocetra persica]